MKSTLYNRLPVFVMAAILAACSATSSDDKKTQLEAMKKEQAKLAKEIQKLETQLTSESPNAVKAKAKEVVVVELAVRKFDHYVQTQGAVESEDNILISAQSVGLVKQVFVSEGQSVSKGQVIAQIDNSLIIRGIEELKSSVELAKTVYQRQKNLWEQKIGTEVQYLQAKNNKESLESKLASLNEQNAMTRIKSPIHGTIDDVFVKIGENIAPGMPAARVINTSDLKIKANISEAYITTIKKGDKVRVSIPESGKDIEARVTFAGKNIDLLSRTFAVEVKLPSFPDLRPNMTAVVKVVFHSEAAAIVVPINIVQNVNGEKIVFVAVKEGDKTIARRKIVEVAGVYDNLAQISKGLSVGDKIVTVGFQSLNDGELIKL